MVAFSPRGQWSDETRLGPVLPPKKAAAGPHVEAVGKDTFYIVWEVFDYSVGNRPVRSGMDDTVVVSPLTPRSSFASLQPGAAD